jgi:sugar (pentulose or hexulose) kinase
VELMKNKGSQNFPQSEPDAPLVLGIDASTTACKALVWRVTGELLADGRASLTLLQPRPLWHEQQAESWWQALVAAVRQALMAVPGSGERLVALCIAPQRETFVPVDQAGIPLRPALLWMDERCKSLLPRIATEYGADRLHRESGKPLSGNLSLGKILWLREEEPELFARTAMYLDVAGFLVRALTGDPHTGTGCVDPMGLFDMQAGAWNDPLLAYLGISECQLPVAFPPGAVIGQVTQLAAEACGLPVGLPVVAGVGDGQSGGLGVGAVLPGVAYLNLGTAVVAGTHADAFVTSRAFRTTFGGVPGSYSLETVILGGTYTIDWFLDRFLAEVAPAPLHVEDYDAALDDVPAGAEGLLLVPYWNSAMNPYWDAEASGIVVGWRGSHRPAHLYRAILEGISLEQRLHTEGVEAALGEPIDRYVAMGGGAKSARWCRIIADVTGKRVYRAGTTEAAALGAGILAAVGGGCFPGVTEAVEAMVALDPDPVVPDEPRHAFYTRIYEEVYRPLFPALRTYLDRLTILALESQG